jgi:hypothetical protein
VMVFENWLGQPDSPMWWRISLAWSLRS